MGEEEEGAAATQVSPPPPPPPRPTITVPPRAPFESFFSSGSIPGFSPGPITLLSNFFSPDSNSFSFSQLLSGTMTSPVAKPTYLGIGSSGTDEDSKEESFGDGNDKGLEGYKQNRPMGLMVPNSPMFFIPPGLSPAGFLNSPGFSAGFLNSPGFLSPLQSPFGMSHQQALAHVTAQAAFSQSLTQMQADFQCSSAASSMEVAETQPSSIPITLQQKASSVEVAETQPSSIPITLQQKADDTSLEHQTLQIVDSSHFDKKPASYAGDKPVDDGFNWRKYGQKLVKDKEHPRSYYKCTYLSCPVKKKVERGPDGHVAEITYKGHHNHDVPQRNVRARDGRTQDGNHQASLRKPNPIAQDRMETLDEDHTSQSHLVKQELPAQLPVVQHYINSEHDETEDSAVVIDEYNYDDELNAQKRNTEFGERVSAPPLKTVTEPKIVVQTRSEVDLLDDGFKWRKYGQKVVKGNSYPRSYYRCTYTGCHVRKHVERASADPKAVITTYEGKHDHDIPIAKGGGGGHNNTNGPSKLRKTSA